MIITYRWVNVLDAKVKKGEWTREEDEKLLQLCQEYQDNGGHHLEHLLLYILYNIHSRTSIIRTLGYPNAALNFKIPKDDLIFCKTK